MTGEFATVGTIQMPVTLAEEIPPGYEKLYPSTVANGLWHQICFRVKHMRIKEDINLFRAAVPPDLPEINVFLHPREPLPRYPNLPTDEQQFENWAGAIIEFEFVDAADPDPSPPTIGSLFLHLGTAFAPGSVTDPEYPPLKTGSLPRPIYATPDVSDVDKALLIGGSFKPIIYAIFGSVAQLTSTVDFDSPLFTTQEVPGRFKIPRMGIDLPMYRLFETGDPAAEAAPVVNSDVIIDWGDVPSSFYEYRDSDGGNPVWDDTTGDPIISPAPQNVDPFV